VFVEFLEFVGCHVGVGNEIGLYVNVAYVGAGVEELREKSDPGEELDFTDFTGLRREALDGYENSFEEVDESGFGVL
jgi:hypothetical protein